MGAGERWRLVPVSANGQPSSRCTGSRTTAAGTPMRSSSVTLDRNARITAITAFLEPDAFWNFGLAHELTAERQIRPRPGSQLPKAT